MAKISASDAKAIFGELLERVSRGEEVVITRHGRAVARLVPEGAQPLAERRHMVAGLHALQESIRRRSGATLANREVRSAIDKGRR
jgi:prevent-host-death family protein